MANNSEGDSQNLTDIAGVGSSKADSLREAGFDSVGDVCEATVDELAEADGIGEVLAAELKENAAEIGADGSTSSTEVIATPDGGQTEVEAEESEEETEASDEEAQSEVGDESEESGEEVSEEPEESEEDSREESGKTDFTEIRDITRETAENQLDDVLDGIIEIGQDDDGWYAVVEVVERSAVPDTQDILGRYEMDFDSSGSIMSYRLVDRYRRGNVS